MAAAGDVQLCYDARILSEYKDVLMRPKFSFNPADVNDLLVQIETCGFAVASTPLTRRLPDSDDEPFLEIALAGRAQCLVTGNIRHYPPKKREGMLIVSPTDFLEFYRRKRIYHGSAG